MSKESWEVELSEDSSVWQNLFRTNKEIRSALQAGGNKLAAKYGKRRAKIKTLTNTQVATIQVDAKYKN